MSRSYPIWNKVKACIYQSDKSFGAKEDSNFEIFVGSSASNSHKLVDVRTRRIETDDKILFKFYIDDVKVKEAIFEKKNGKAFGEPEMIVYNNFKFEQGDLA